MENLEEMSLMMGQQTREEEFDYRSGSDNYEAGSGSNDQNNNNAGEERSSKRKKYHRHTAYQIQELENSFKENPHPDEKSRLELGRKLGLESRQVKFWFQNRRTQMKTQLERHENAMLKQENDKLRFENVAMKDAVRNPICENCGSPAILGEISIEQHHLMIENARLKDELSRLSVLANKFLGAGPIARSTMMSERQLCLAIGMNTFDPSMELTLPSADLLPFGNVVAPANVDFPFDKSLLLSLALTAMDELLKLGQVDGPMWFRSAEGEFEALNFEEYAKNFSPMIGEKPSHFVSEATRACGTVVLDGPALVEAFMDVNRWTEMFPGNVGRALTAGVISFEAGGGTLHLMQAEFIASTAMVPLRRVKFIRFCKRHGDDTWAVVDLSIDFLLHGANENALSTCRRPPSGCIIRNLSNGCSKVIWVEHTEYDETIIPPMCRPLARCGLAFGALRWLANLQRQCELFATVVSSSSPHDDHSALPPNGKRSIVRLAQRMTRSFCLGISGAVHEWESVQNADDVRLTMRRSAGGDSGEPSGAILSAATTVWLPLLPKFLLEFLQNEGNRRLWDVLCKDGSVEKVLHFPKSRSADPGNSISLLHENAKDRTSVFILQDTCGDASGSLVVYGAVEASGMNSAMNGGDVSKITILPSGFSIVPDCLSRGLNEGGYGSLLTVGFQILADGAHGDGKLSVESVDTVKSLIAQTIQGIKANLI